MTIAGVLLAAGASRRFGTQDKLLAPFGGRPLIYHAAEAMRLCGFDHLIAVVTSDEVAHVLAGFDVTRPTPKVPEQSDSILAGLAATKARGATKMLIALGDMPFVDTTILRAVAEHCSDKTPSAATDGDRIMPPVCFPRSYFQRLSQVTGDRGAGRVIKALPKSALVHVSSEVLADIDTTDELNRLDPS